MRFVSASILLCFCAAPASASVLATSDFSADNQGWAALTADIAAAGIPLQTSSAASFQATGGNPGGRISITDPDNFDTFFRAPAAYLGDQSAAIGGSLSFDTITDQPVDYNGADVVIKGNGAVLVYDIAPTASNQWSSVSATLAPSANWRLNNLNGPVATLADFQNVLGNVSELWIAAEYHAGLGEITALDNVALSAVPEPAAAATMICCIGAASIGRRRRRW